MELTAELVSRRLRDASDQQILIVQTFQSSKAPTIPATTAAHQTMIAAATHQ